MLIFGTTDIRYQRSDIRYYRFCVYSVYSVMRNDTSVGDHVTAQSYQSSSLWLVSIT